MIEKSFQLIRTNPALTTNVKIVINSDYEIYLESFNSNKDLNSNKYKHYKLNKETYYEDKLPKFYDKLPVSSAFEVKYDNDVSIMYDDYYNQFDTEYFSGARNISDQWHTEEFEYFAPLYIKKESLPESFVILRVDEPAIYEKKLKGKSLLDSISELDKDNFREEIIDKWKVVSVFDLSYETNLGYWIDRNFRNNKRFPNVPFEFDSKEYNFSRWNGIDYKSGVYTQKSVYLKDKLWVENLHWNLEKSITDGYKDNSIVFPNILNFKFLFDDSPSTPFAERKWSSNRYYGFYAEELEFVTNLTTYKPPTITYGVDILNNVFVWSGTSSATTTPFNEEVDINNIFLYANNTLNKVQKNGNYYKIMSEYNLSLEDINRHGVIDINFEYTGNTYKNSINSPISGFTIDSFINDKGEFKCLYGDLYLIKIDDKYHVLKGEEILTGGTYYCDYYIHSDFAINSNDNYLEYWVNNKENYKKISILQDGETPLLYPIYRIKFCDVKDFDYDILDTRFSDFDYETVDYNVTPEHKLYAVEHRDSSFPEKQFKVYPQGDKNQFKVINVSSEYVSTDELFQITKSNELTKIWRKNPVFCKWGFMGSNSHSDYTYKLNNSNKVGFEFNRTTDITKVEPDIYSKNLDYFYRIGQLHDSGLYKNYVQQSTNIETETYNHDSKLFNLDYYVTSDFDYFDYFFKNKMKYNILSDTNNQNTKENFKKTNKYSVFVNGDEYDSSETLFKGIKFNIHSIDKILRDDDSNKIEKIITNNLENYNNYKLSIIFNPCYRKFYGCEWIPEVQEDPPIPAHWGNCSGETSFTANTYQVLNPVYLDTVTWNDLYDGVYGYNYSWANICISGSGYMDDFLENNFYVYKHTVKNLKETKIERISDFKGYDNYYIGISSRDVVNFTGASYFFDGLDVDGFPRNFSGDTWRAYTGDTTQYYNIHDSGSETVYISLKYLFSDDCDHSTFTKTLLNPKGEIFGIYEEYDCCSGGGVYDNSYINECQNSINVFLNKKYKNVLIIINSSVEIFNDWFDLNNVTKFGENYGLYTSKGIDGVPLIPQPDVSVKPYNPKLITAYNFINAINNMNQNYNFDDCVVYHMIDEDANYYYASMDGDSGRTTFTNLTDWNEKFPPFVLSVSTPEPMSIKKNSYDVFPIKGPKYNIYDKYKSKKNVAGETENIINEPLGRFIKDNNSEITTIRREHGEKLEYDKLIYRYNGAYEPVFKDIELFRHSDYLITNDMKFSIESYPIDYNVSSSGHTGYTWKNMENLFKEDFRYIRHETDGTNVYSDVLYIDFDLEIIDDAYITGIEVSFIKKATNSVYDRQVQLTLNGVEVGDNKANTTDQWILNQRVVDVYGGKNDLWGLSLTSSDIPNLGVSFQSRMVVSSSVAELDTFVIKVYYINQGLQSGVSYSNYIEDNYQFDTELTNFGTIKEIIYSKVNPDKNILKLRNAEEDKSIYPMVDEFGYQITNRFIFKSNWDDNYYIKTNNKI